MEIINCDHTDIGSILELYTAARQLQTEKKMVVWPAFEKPFIQQEIEEKRQWKILAGKNMACNWAITFDDKDIWQEKEKGDAIYIHRIATHPSHRGNRYIDSIVTWARYYAHSLGRQYIRLDTLGNNTSLIKHYTSAGFDFLGIHHLPDTSRLPGHYKNEPDCCLFEIKF